MKQLMTLIVLLFGLMYSTSAQDKLVVVTTTTLLADVARNVGGDLVNITALVPQNADTHAWTPTPADVALVVDADMVLAVGAGYEQFLGTLVENAGKEPIIVTNGVEMLAFGEHGHEEGNMHDENEVESIGIYGQPGVCDDEHEAETEHTETEEEAHEHGACDPHVWTVPKNVALWAANIAEAFAAADPAHADIYRASAAAYSEQLNALDSEVRDIIAVVPEENRILVTNHEFLGYFAHEYGFEVVGVVITGGSTASEPDPQSLAALIDVVREEGAGAIFVEVSSSSGLAETVAQEAGVGVVTALYSESLSGDDGPASTYLDYIRTNAQTIADALR